MLLDVKTTNGVYNVDFNAEWLKQYGVVDAGNVYPAAVKPNNPAQKSSTTSISGRWLHDVIKGSVGCIVLGNVVSRHGANIYVTVTLDSSTIINNELIYDSAQAASVHPHQKLGLADPGVVVLKHLPIYLSTTNKLELNYNSVLTITITHTTGDGRYAGAGWWWIGDLLTTKAGMQKPTSLSITSSNQELELENGDTILHTSYYKRQLDCVFNGGTNEDTNIIQSNMLNGAPYYINCFNPYTVPVCLPSRQAISSTDSDKWKSHSGLFMLNSPLSISRKFYELSSYSLKFKEVL